MEIVSIGLTVYFEDGFWHGLFEQEYEGTYQVCRVTFGQEPKEDEILKLLQTQFVRLSFSPVATVKQHVKIKNPKRLQRAVKKQVKQEVSSKSQELLQLQHEERKKHSKQQSSLQKQLLKQEKFERKQQKRREKHKGH
ncbi:YjdF family protein [Streptococcus oralis]|uniref:YjdF family protein n=1 Tax=Streptococcus oralis TaxID=1303 RepID=UPI00189BFD7D|nr:YjdF family protein [Streptococcus oralis]